MDLIKDRDFEITFFLKVMSTEQSTAESELQRTNDDSKATNSAVKIFKVKRHRDDAPSETISKGSGVVGASKKKRRNQDTPESVAVKLEACSLAHETRTHDFGRNRMFKKIATMKKLKKKDEFNLVVHSLKLKFNRRRNKRRSKRFNLVSKISKTPHLNKRGTRSKQLRKKHNQFELHNKRANPKETPRTSEKHNTTNHYDVPSHKELIIDIYSSTSDKKERRYWRRRYPYLREEEPTNESDSDLEDDETDIEGELEEDEDDDYVYDYYIDGHQYIQEMIASGCQIVEVDFDEIEPECEEYLGNDYPEEESESAKDYFSSIDDDEDLDDFAPCY